MNIEVQGPLHNRVSAELVGDAWRAMQAIIVELERGSKEYGVNNNNLREKGFVLRAAVNALCDQINGLPPQGRVIHFEGRAVQRLASQMVEFGRKTQ